MNLDRRGGSRAFGDEGRFPHGFSLCGFFLPEEPAGGGVAK